MVKRFLTESFLEYYFLIEAACSGFLSPRLRRTIFYSLADIFCIERDASLERLYENTELSWVHGIQDKTSYERFCRVLEFAGESGFDSEITPLDRSILAGKRGATLAKSAIFDDGNAHTENAVVTALNGGATKGNVYALGVLAYMEYNGICITPSVDSAIRHIRRCARWNDLFGNLFAIRCDGENSEEYYGRLKTVLDLTGRGEVFAEICRFNGYVFTGKADSKARILNRAFSVGTAVREQYSRVVSDLLFSELVSFKDKETALTGGQKEHINELNTLPLGAKRLEGKGFDLSCAEKIPLDRSEESGKIVSSIDFMLSVPDQASRPLMVVSADDFIGEMYVDMIRDGLGGMSCAELDASAFTGIELSHTKENVFIRAVAEAESLNAVCVIKNCHELSDDCFYELVKLLDYDYRRSYNTVQPSATVDLSGLKLILLADEGSRQAKLLSGLCDTVVTKRLQKSERANAVDYIFKARTTDFGLCGITVDEDCLEYLSRCDLSQIRSTVDTVIKRAFREKSRRIQLSDVQSACLNHCITASAQSFGFGGGIKDNA